MSTPRAFLFVFIAALAAASAMGQTATRPPVGGVASLPDAMIFYVAHGPLGACGPGCSDWIAAEGTVQWDTHKRLIAILDRQAGRKLPLVIHAWGEANLNVAVSLGRILHDRGFDTTEGSTEVAACAGKAPRCDIACVLILAGGIHRSLPAGTRMILTGMTIKNRLAPNVSEERREGLTTLYGEQFRVYLREMGLDTELLDNVAHNAAQQHATEVPVSDWTRLHIVTSAPK